jgi:hypothetical protein
MVSFARVARHDGLKWPHLPALAAAAMVVSASLPARPQLASQARGHQIPVAGAPSYADLSVISCDAPGTTCGNHRAYSSRHPGASPDMVFAVQMLEPTRKAGRNPYRIPPYKRGVTGSNPVAPTRFRKMRCPGRHQLRDVVDRHGPLLRIGRGDRGCTGRLEGGGKQVASRQAAVIFKCMYADRPYPYRRGSTQAEQPVITPAFSSRCMRR